MKVDQTVISLKYTNVSKILIVGNKSYC